MEKTDSAGGGLIKKASDLLRGLYDWVEKWAQTPYSLHALFLIAVAESAFFPVPPDILLIAMGVSQSKRSLWFAFVCTVGSVMGGALGYAMGWGFWSALDTLFFNYVPGFTPELFEKVTQVYQEAAFPAIFTSAFTITAGVAQINFGVFIFASILGRGLRFFIVGGLLFFFGPKIKDLIDKYFEKLALLFCILGVGGILAMKYIF